MRTMLPEEEEVPTDARARWVPRCLWPALIDMANGWQMRHSRGKLRDVPCCMGCGRQIRIRTGDAQPVDGWLCLACRQQMASRLDKIRKRERGARRGAEVPA